MSELAFKHDLLSGDLTKISSYAKMNGKVVCRDTGLNRETYREYYEDDDSSKSSSSTPKTSES